MNTTTQKKEKNEDGEMGEMWNAFPHTQIYALPPGVRI